ncbi:MAG: GNAT family N-acetyltransferase [Streptosporangiales bacterium]|nr:GNAT family N-acetyltransferase [Streptosporangiales bacterium]
MTEIRSRILRHAGGKSFDLAGPPRFARSMQISRVRPRGDEAAVHAVHSIQVAARDADRPEMPVATLAHTAAWVAAGTTSEPHIVWLAADDAGRPAGFALLDLPYTDNRHVALLDLVVRPDARRQGIGRALLGHAVEYARAAGRTLLVGEAVEDSAGAGFAKVAGAECKALERCSYQTLDDVDPASIAAMRAEAERAATGYELVRWIDVAPPEYLPDLAELNNEMRDAPVDDLQIEDEIWDVERVRIFDQAVMARGRRSYFLAARHVESGRLAGYSQLTVDGTDWANQGNTVVMRAHRGHRLGLWLKAAMVEWVRVAEPDVRRVLTWNAKSNQHMLAVNDRLGYVAYEFVGEWELPLT